MDQAFVLLFLTLISFNCSTLVIIIRGLVSSYSGLA